MRRTLPTVLACAASAAVITWLGTYLISPMDPLLAAPAWTFSRLFVKFVEIQPAIASHATLEQIIVFSRVANFTTWFAVFLLCALIVRRMVLVRRPVV